MTQYQINNCVYRVMPPTVGLRMFAWIRYTVAEFFRALK